MAFSILIVDDSATTRLFIKRTIRLAGLPVAEVLEAPTGQAGLEVLAARPVDLVLADLHMPQMSGVEMTRRLLADEKTRHIPVVVISAEPDVARLEALKQEGVRGYLRKPTTPEAVRAVLTDVLGVVHA